MKKKFLKISSVILPVALIAVMALSGCEKPNSPPLSQNEVAAQQVGAGETTFDFEVTGGGGETVKFSVNTNETTVGAALLEAGLIEGEVSEYGLYVKSVNGITADYDADKAYWAFYIDGEYATAGADATEIDTDKAYAFVYTKD